MYPLLEPIQLIPDMKVKMVGTFEADVKQCGEQRQFAPQSVGNRRMYALSIFTFDLIKGPNCRLEQPLTPQFMFRKCYHTAQGYSWKRTSPWQQSS